MRPLKILLIFSAALAGGCAHSAPKVDWIAIGPRFPAKSVEQVEVFNDYSELKHKSGAIGEMKGESLDKNDPELLNAQVRLARRLSAENGADAVIVKKKELLQESGPFTDSPTPPLFYIHARAIKYVHNLTPEELEIVKRWRPPSLEDFSSNFSGGLYDVDGTSRSR